MEAATGAEKKVFRRKINQIKANRAANKDVSVYDAYTEPLDFFLNSLAGGRNLKELKACYVEDGETVRAIRSIVKSQMNSINVLVGYRGIGKTTDVRYALNCGNNGIRLDESGKTIIVPVFYHSYVTDLIEGQDDLGKPYAVSENGTGATGSSTVYETTASAGEDISDGEPGEILEEGNNPSIKHTIVSALNAICIELERLYPEIAEHLSSEEGKQGLLDYMIETNSWIFGDAVNIEKEDADGLLKRALANEPFVYAASKLKFLLSSDYCIYNRIFIVVDNIDVVPARRRKALILQYLRCFSCFMHVPNETESEGIYVNLLFTMRPETYKEVKEEELLYDYGTVKEIYKSKGIDLSEYFKKKADLIPNRNRRMWGRSLKETKQILTHLCEKFDHKFSEMIMGLVNRNVKTALTVIGGMMKNSYWFAKCSGTAEDGTILFDYNLNNIGVIRAISCGPNVVYRGTRTSLTPNIMYNEEHEDNSLIAMYMIAYFRVRDNVYGNYGIRGVDSHRLFSDMMDVFGSLEDFEDRMKKTFRYLVGCGVFAPGIPKTSGYMDREPASASVPDSGENDNLQYYLSSNGLEIWDYMLVGDSVLLEAYREDYYQDFPNPDAAETDQFRSSWDLMNSDRQVLIFKELYLLLQGLYEKEKVMIAAAVDSGAKAKLVNCFGEESMVAHLKQGVDCSVGYSGNWEHSDVMPSREVLERELANHV